MLVVLLLAALMSASTLHAQHSPFGFVGPGDRVRLQLPEAGAPRATTMQVGVLSRASADSISVTWESGGTTAIALSRIARLEVSDGPQPFVAAGMGYGFLGGALLGAIHGSSQESNDYFSTTTIVTVSSVLGGLGGAIVGGVVGAVGRRERWSTVRPDAPLRRVRVSPSLLRGSVGLGGSVRF